MTLEEYAGQLQTVIETMESTELIQTMLELSLADMQKHFSDQGPNEDGSGWLPLTEKYLKYKAQHNQPSEIAIAEGTMAQSFEAEVFNSSQGIIRNTSEHAHWFDAEEGSGYNSRRNFMYVSEEADAAISQIIDARLTELLD